MLGLLSKSNRLNIKHKIDLFNFIQQINSEPMYLKSLENHPIIIEFDDYGTGNLDSNRTVLVPTGPWIS